MDEPSIDVPRQPPALTPIPYAFQLGSQPTNISQGSLISGDQRPPSSLLRNISPTHPTHPSLSSNGVLNMGQIQSPISVAPPPLAFPSRQTVNPTSQTQTTQFHISTAVTPTFTPPSQASFRFASQEKPTSPRTLSVYESKSPIRKRSSLFQSSSVPVGLESSTDVPSPVPESMDSEPTRSQLRAASTEKLEEDSPFVEALSDMTFTMMMTAWTSLETRHAVADQKWRMTILQRAFSHWITKSAELVNMRNYARRGRAAIREMMRKANWKSTNEDLLPNRARFALFQEPLTDERYATTLASVR